MGRRVLGEPDLNTGAVGFYLLRLLQIYVKTLWSLQGGNLRGRDLASRELKSNPYKVMVSKIEVYGGVNTTCNCFDVMGKLLGDQYVVNT